MADEVVSTPASPDARTRESPEPPRTPNETFRDETAASPDDDETHHQLRLLTTTTSKLSKLTDDFYKLLDLSDTVHSDRYRDYMNDMQQLRDKVKDASEEVQDLYSNMKHHDKCLEEVVFRRQIDDQDAKFIADNILLSGEPKKWLCAKGTKTGVLEATIQLEKECVISSVHVGNHGSSFIELSVGRSDWPQDREYETLMPTSSLMPPRDAKVWERVETVQMYKRENFIEAVRDQPYDRLRVRCTQPLRKDKQFGLNFLRVHAADDVKSPSLWSGVDLDAVKAGAERLKRRYMELTGAEMEDIVASPSTPAREQLCSRTERIFKTSVQTPPQASTSGTPETPGSADGKKAPAQNFYVDMESFLKDLNVKQVMDDDLQVSDLREKLEKILCRKLSKPEKKVFRQRVPEYIQEIMDRAERKAQRKKQQAKDDFILETKLPELSSPKSRSRKSSGASNTPKAKIEKSEDPLDFDRIFDDITELPNISPPKVKQEAKVKTPKPKSAIKSKPVVSNSTTPKRPRSVVDSDEGPSRKYTPGRSFLRKDPPTPNTTSQNQEYYVRQAPEKKPKIDYSSSGGFLASDEILNRLGQASAITISDSPEMNNNRSKNANSKNVGPIVIDQSPSTSSYTGRKGYVVASVRQSMGGGAAERREPPGRAGAPPRSVHRLPPVVCTGESRAQVARRVVPPVRGRRIKDVTVNDKNSSPSMHPSCLPVLAQGPGRRTADIGPGRRLGAAGEDTITTTCPLCSELFPSDVIEEHAATCDGLPDLAATANRNDDVILDSSDVIVDGSALSNIACPMCGSAFGPDEIEAHADRCADSGVMMEPIVF